MRNTLVFVGVLIAGVLTWIGYAFVASLMTDDLFKDCLWSDMVITLFFATGWILPSLVGYDLYRYLYRHERRRERMIDWEIRQIKKNTFGELKSSFSKSFHSFHREIHLN